ncbi:MAG: FAD-binding oxidoreductase, partial [Gammaproteobacteria bacterium]
LGDAIEAGCATDAVVAESVAQSRALWHVRESIPMAQAEEGINIKHDIALPVSAIDEFVAVTDADLARRFPGVRVIDFGHLGDGNLHYNVQSPPADRSGPADEEWFLGLQPAINLLVHDSVAAFNGSISAEHGLGQLRRDEAARYKSPVEMALMQRLKKCFDPLGIMNPGKVLAED